MPPKKRKLVKVENSDTDEDSSTKPTAIETKKAKTTFSIFSKQKPEVKITGESLKYDLEWCEHGDEVKNLKPLFYLCSKSLKGSKKVAAFDIDFTIIKTKSGKKFPTDYKDWTWFDNSVRTKLAELHESDYRILFVTNQAGIEKGRVKFSELKKKFQSIVATLDIPIFLFVATGENHFRKPSTEIWNFFTSSLNKSVDVDMKESFYVGDAAGRPKNWAPGKSKDFSCADRMFAHNIGLDFHTPEEYFLNQKKVEFEWRSINPLKILEKLESDKSDETKEYHKKEQEMIVFVGPPASGKSTFTKRYFIPYKYVHINRDTLGTHEKCLKVAETNLSEGKSIVIDNTNASKATRNDFIKLANKFKLIHIRCFKMTTLIELCHHLNYFRQNLTKSKVRRIPDVGYNMYKSRYEDPLLSDGFTDIVNVDFQPQFDSAEDEMIFKQWTS